MTDNKKHPEWDKFPGTLENPSDFRKGSGDYGITFAVPVKHVGYLKPLMEQAQRAFAVFVVPASSIDQAELLLKEKDAHPQGISDGGTPTPLSSDFFVPVETLAAVLGVDPRTVQLDAEKGLLVRATPGRYDTLASCGTLRRALKDAENNISDDHRAEKILILREQRIKLEALNKERLGQLMNAEKTRQAIEHLGAEDRQALLNMPKTLGPSCDMLPGREVEIKLMDWVRKHLKEESAWDRIVGLVRASLSTLPVRQGSKGKKRKKKK